MKISHLERFDISHVVVGSMVVASAVMLAMLVAGIFDPEIAIILTLVVLAPAGALVIRRSAPSTSARATIGFSVVLLIALALRWHPFLYVEGGQDQGIYVAMSSHFARTQGLAVTDDIRGRLTDAQAVQYDKLNNQHHIIVPSRYEGWHQPGVYITDAAKNAYAFQFYPLHPLWMAAVGRVFGEESRAYSLVIFSLLGILTLSMLAYEISNRSLVAAGLVALTLAANPLSVFVGRFPVVESCSAFFLAAAVLFYVKHLTTHNTDRETPWNLIISAGAWGGMFFSHISGFLFAPVIAVFATYGVLTSTSEREFRWLLFYGLAVSFLFSLSLWYGVTWSFPYTYDIYRAGFGERAGKLIVQNWLVMMVSATTLGAAVMALAWRWRKIVLQSWSRLCGTRILAFVAAALIFGTLFASLYDAYLVGFTNTYSDEPVLTKQFRLTNSGWNGFFHSSAIALAAYVSPVLLAWFLYELVTRGRDILPLEMLLLVMVALFFIVRIWLTPITFYYYYGRYFAAELLPFMTVLWAVWVAGRWGQGSRGARVICAFLVFLLLAWNVVLVSRQYPGGEMHRMDASLKPWLNKIDASGVVLFSGARYPQLRTTLEYVYGRRTVEIEPAELRDAVRRYLANWPNVYVLTESPTLPISGYLGAISIARDTYKRGHGPSDLLPSESLSLPGRFYLYQAMPADFERLQRADRVTFNDTGNASNYLVSGWSGQESTMRWTEGTSASISLPVVPEALPLALVFEVLTHGCIEVGVRVNGEPRTTWRFPDCSKYVRQKVELKPSDIARGGIDSSGRRRVMINLDTPNAKSPAEVNPMLTDSRRLGVSVKQIVVGEDG
jgi:hypothetical protein